MNRFIAFLMLVSFVVRQFDCCSGNCQASSCQELRRPASVVDSVGNRCACHHHSCPADANAAKACSLNDDVDPASHHSHQHHLCVANHLVYTSTQRVATETLQTGMALATTDVLFESKRRTPGEIGGKETGPPRVGCLPRTQLGVYRI